MTNIAKISSHHSTYNVPGYILGITHTPFIFSQLCTVSPFHRPGNQVSTCPLSEVQCHSACVPSGVFFGISLFCSAWEKGSYLSWLPPQLMDRLIWPIGGTDWRVRMRKKPE